MGPSPRLDATDFEYRPYWQLLLLAGILVLAAYAGSHTKGAPWNIPKASTILSALLVVGLCVVFRFLSLGRMVAPLLQEASEHGEKYSTRDRLLWPLAGFVGVLTALLLLERAFPFYFSQDDNLDANLPVMLQGCRSFFQGVFPEWNPYQFMGSPTAVLGYYAFTYPLTYASYWFARNGLRDANAMIDVLAFAHLLLGYLAFYWVVRREHCRPSIAMLAASCYALSGYALIFTRSFVQFSSILLWVPLLVACLQSLVRGNTSWKWIFAFGACIGFFFHAGHIQMWAYALVLTDFAILLFVATGAIRFSALTQCLAAHLVGLAIAAPLLIPELLAARNAARFPDDTGILSGLKGLFILDSISPSPHPVGWGAGYPIGEMYYSGTLFMLLAAVLLISLLAMRWEKSTARANAWFLCGLLAFLFALGSRGILWMALVHVPGFDRFRFPFKFLGFMDLFLIIAGAVVLERLMRHKHLGIQVELAMVIAVWALLAYHCTLATASFCNYSFTPFPAPDPQITRRLLPDGERYYPKVMPAETMPDGRIAAMGRDGSRSTDPRFLDSFMNQWPTLSGVFSIHGYDPLVYDSPAVRRMTQRAVQSPQQALAEYGVKYFLQYTRPEMPGGNVFLGWPGVRLVYASRTVCLYELPDVRPMSFPESDPQRALRVKFEVTGASIDTSELPRGGTVILNMLWREEYQAIANGSPLRTDADAWGRIRMVVPAGAPIVRLVLRLRWELGWIVAAALLLCGLALGWLSNRRMRKVG